MNLDTGYLGKFIQVSEALDFGDAVSNQIIEIDKQLKSAGIRCEIASKWRHERVRDLSISIDELSVCESDIVVFHHSGYAEFSLPAIADIYCTKIFVYHNITPHEFFPADSRLYNHCKRGREQLTNFLKKFHYYWADSEFNLSELIGLGVKNDKCAVVPIIVPNRFGSDRVNSALRNAGEWLFVGRVAPNKRQDKIIDLFHETRINNSGLASRLIFVGAFDAEDYYYLQCVKKIEQLGLSDLIEFTGKVEDSLLDRHFKSASVFVSMSEHEGFGVPLVEASRNGLFVIALDRAAVSETLGHNHIGIIGEPGEFGNILRKISSDKDLYIRSVNEQILNSNRFLPEVVRSVLFDAIEKILPERRRFKSVSVVICTYNRKAYLERVLHYLQYQSCESFEVVVVDGPSDDGTKELLSGYSDTIKIAHNSQRNLSISRNIGIELCSGDLIAFIDDDAIPFDDWICSILQEFNSRPLSFAGLGGPVYYAGTFWFQAEDNGINKFADAKVNILSNEIGKLGWLRYNTGTNAVFTRDSLYFIGGFDEEFEYYLDESELCYRLQVANGLIGYTTEILVRHEFAQSHNRMGGYNYNWYSICKNTAYFVARHSGLCGDELRGYVEKKIFGERVCSMDEALAKGEIGQEQYDKYIAAIWGGVKQGLFDAQSPAKTRELKLSSSRLLPYPTSGCRLRVSKELAQLHICIVSKEFPPFGASGGVGTLYYHLASELLLMGHRITVIVPAENDHLFEQGRFRVVFSKVTQNCFHDVDGGFCKNISWSTTALHTLANIHSQSPIDIVDSALWDTEAIALALLPATQRPPLVVRLVTPYSVSMKINGWSVPDKVSSLYIDAEKALISKADAVVPISESIKNTIFNEHKLLPDFRWKKISCGIAYWPFFDVSKGYCEFQELENIPKSVLESDKLVVFVGRLELRKGIDLLLHAANKFLLSDKRTQFLIAGRDTENWKVKSNGILNNTIKDRVHFLGEVADSTRDKILARAYCLLFPSRYESFGLVPLEAFVHGVPVVAAKAAAIPEVVQDGVSGLLFEADSGDSLAECVIRLIRTPALRQRLSLGALVRIRQLSSRNSAQASVELYSRLVVSKPRIMPS